jgi:hypothetical protein
VGPPAQGDSNGSRRAESVAQLTFPFRVEWLLLDRCVPSGHRLKGGNRAMNTQIRNTGGFTNNFWVQMAALVIVTLAVIALAAKYIW